MNVVFDTNVLVAAFAARGICADLLEVCLKQFRVVTSEFILVELHGICKSKLKLPEAKANGIIEFLREVSQVVEPAVLPADSCRDPADISILGTAVAGKAEVLISGDEDLLVLKKFQNTVIVTPREFWSLLVRK